ncbi:tetratricopeptide repeat protein [Desulfosoma sp.]
MVFLRPSTVAVVFIGWLVALAVPGLPAQKAQDLPLPARVVLTEIQPLIGKKDFGQAVEKLRAFQARGGPPPEPGTPDPKGHHHPYIYYVLGNCYLSMEQFQPAAAAYRQAVARDPRFTDAWLNLARASYEMKDYGEAGHCFKKGYDAAEEKNPEHLYLSAAAYLMAGDHAQSIAAFEQLLRAHPKEIKAQWKEHLVHALLAARQPRRALPYIRELADVYTGDKKLEWQEILLYQYLQLGLNAEALALARTLAEQSPTTARWWKALAHIQLNADRNEDALAALTIYSFLTPLSWEERKLLADLSLQVGIPAKAVAAYEGCLKEKPNRDILQRLVMAYRQLGRSDMALKHLEDFGHPLDHGELLMLKGELLYELKQFDRAADVFRRVAKNHGPHAGRAWLMAGYCAWHMQDLSTSKEDFTRAAQYPEEKKAALAALQHLTSVSR